VTPSQAIEAHPLLSVGKGTGVMILSTALLFAFSFFSRVAVARAFSVASWGLFNLGLSLVNVLSIVGLLGIHQAVARTISYETDPEVRRSAIRWGLAWSTLSAVGLTAAIFFFAGPIAAVFQTGYTAELTVVFQLFAFTIGFLILATYLASIFQGFEDAGPQAWFNQVLQPGLFLAFVLLFLFFHLGFVGAILGYVLSGAMTLGALAVYTWRRLDRLLPARRRRRVSAPKGLGPLSVSLWGVTSLTLVTIYVDTLILGLFRPALEVGYYSAAMTLARLLIIGQGALTYIYLPVSARLVREGDHSALRESYVTATRWILLFTLPMFLLFTFDPQLSLSAVFGPAYVNGATALAIIGWGSVLSTIVGPSSAALAGMGYARSLLVVTTLSAITNVALSFALIPSYGLIGAALAWTIARVVFSFGGNWVLWTNDRITPFRRRLTLPLALSLAFGIPLYIVLSRVGLAAWAVVPLYVLGMLIFLVATLGTRSLEPGDLVATHVLERLVGRPLPTLRRRLARFVTPADGSATSVP
jgi:O-antigen/teichoic acid export membrane protein